MRPVFVDKRARTRLGVVWYGASSRQNHPNVEAFRKNLASSRILAARHSTDSAPITSSIGTPDFRFSDYEDWIKSRFAPRHYQKLKEKMGLPSLYAIGAFIQSLSQNPGIENELRELGNQAHVYVGTGLGSLDTTYKASIALYKSQVRWDAFWAHRTVIPNFANNRGAYSDAPPETELEEWNRYWMARSPELQEYLAELSEIDSLSIHDGEVATAKLHLIREKEKRHAKLREKWNTPEPPWHVSADVIWNIHNTPAAQISILGGITGLAFAPVAACSTFGVALGLAARAIQSGDAKMVVVGATDRPAASSYSRFFLQRPRSLGEPDAVGPADGTSGHAHLRRFRVWIVADYDYMQSKGFKPLGMEPVSVGLSSDAHHIITPSIEGPKAAILQALSLRRRRTRMHIGTWDLHATATPGRLFRSRYHAIRSSGLRSGHGPKGNLRPRHERRQRLGADSAVHGI